MLSPSLQDSDDNREEMAFVQINQQIQKHSVHTPTRPENRVGEHQVDQRGP
jgi:hypothetical protein